MSLKHGDSLLLNQEIKNGKATAKKIKEPGLGEIQDGHLAFPSSLTDFIFIWWAKAFPGYSVDALTMSSQKKKIMFHWILSSRFVN